jgi:hypothetical protein
MVRVDSNTFTMGNPMPESFLTLCQSRLYLPVRDIGFGLWRAGTTLIDCSKIPAPEPEFVNISRSPGIYSQPGWRNRFLGSFNVYKYGLCTKGYIQPMIAQTPRILSFSINYRSYTIALLVGPNRRHLFVTP